MKITVKYFPGYKVLATSISRVIKDQWMPVSNTGVATIK